MELPPIDTFITLNLQLLQEIVEDSRKQGLRTETMPPHFSLMYSDGEMLRWSVPEIWSELPVDFWGHQARLKMTEEEGNIGFILWCIADNGDEERLFCLFHVKNKQTVSLVSHLDFSEVKLVDLNEILPELDVDYNEKAYAH